MTFKRLIEKCTDTLLVALLGLLGFSCSDKDDIKDLPLMYGTPILTYKIKGKVYDKSYKRLDATLRVKYRDVSDNSEWKYVQNYFVDSERVEFCTSKDGKYAFEYSYLYDHPEEAMIVCTPISDKYEADSAIIKFGIPQDGGEWYLWSNEATINFMLKEKTNE